jgi:hypothetical protein
VLSEIAREEHNSLWHLFSGIPEVVHFGAVHYRQHLADMSGIVNKLFDKYHLEGIAMPYTIEDFRREYLAELPPQKRLEGLSPEERLKGLSVDEIKAYLKRLEQVKKPSRGSSTKARKPNGGKGRSSGRRPGGRPKG